jgi:hypothetical protein
VRVILGGPQTTGKRLVWYAVLLLFGEGHVWMVNSATACDIVHHDLNELLTVQGSLLAHVRLPCNDLHFRFLQWDPTLPEQAYVAPKHDNVSLHEDSKELL